MWHSPARRDGRGHLSAATAPHWLLIGNSRWHWVAHPGDGGPGGWSEPPLAGAQRLQGLAAQQLLGWAAVGAVPAELLPLLPERRQVSTAQVPLADAPPWLGVDRALAGWGAWRRSDGQPVLVADAGTALSLTRVGADGRFAGGRLMAGAGLQLQALGQGTAALPCLDPAALAEGAAAHGWPAPTAAAMAVGVVQGLAAALAGAAVELESWAGGPCRLWLTGGDAPLLESVLQARGQPWRLDPGLVLDALAELRPGPGL